MSKMPDFPRPKEAKQVRRKAYSKAVAVKVRMTHGGGAIIIKLGDEEAGTSPEPASAIEFGSPFYIVIEGDHAEVVSVAEFGKMFEED